MPPGIIDVDGQLFVEGKTELNLFEQPAGHILRQEGSVTAEGDPGGGTRGQDGLWIGAEADHAAAIGIFEDHDAYGSGIDAGAIRECRGGKEPAAGGQAQPQNLEKAALHVSTPYAVVEQLPVAIRFDHAELTTIKPEM